MCFLRKGRKCRFCACTPEPAGVCRIETFFLTFYINWMIYQNVITFLHHFTKNRVLRKILTNGLTKHIMWLCQFYHISAIPDQQMTITGSYIKLISFILQTFPDCIQQNCCICGTDFTRAVINNRTVFIIFFLFGQSNQITAKCNICILHVHADTECLQRRTTGIIDSRVVSQYGKVCRITSRLHSIRNRVYHSNL